MRKDSIRSTVSEKLTFEEEIRFLDSRLSSVPKEQLASTPEVGRIRGILFQFTAEEQKKIAFEKHCKYTILIACKYLLDQRHYNFGQFS